MDHIITSPELAKHADHRLQAITGGSAGFSRMKADVIVSHLSISWRNLPRLAALRICNPGARIVHVEHSYTENFVRLNVPSKKRFYRLLRLSYGLFDNVAAVSLAQQDWLARIGAIRPEKLTLVRSFVDLSAFQALPVNDGPIRVIGAIGRLEPQKGFDVMIRAFRACERTDLELHFYGTGSEGAALKCLAGGDPRIRFMGFCPDPVSAMGKVDAVVMPSRWEAYGLVAIEALAARRPLFVNGLDGLRDHLSSGAVEVPADTQEGWRDVLDQMPRNAVSCRMPQAIQRLETEFLDAWSTQFC
ncbi:glycosyltransferase [Actibacterium ureilyticum]|uniref:glycosyltransferase n=1 Tax=Actibacterium ureilyticum TaxID=1590614 RepID=UPI001FEA0D3E|nr:glycosyltransferase [Actibacterium ureilyticum]